MYSYSSQHYRKDSDIQEPVLHQVSKIVPTLTSNAHSSDNGYHKNNVINTKTNTNTIVNTNANKNKNTNINNKDKT